MQTAFLASTALPGPSSPGTVCLWTDVPRTLCPLAALGVARAPRLDTLPGPGVRVPAPALLQSERRSE